MKNNRTKKTLASTLLLQLTAVIVLGTLAATPAAAVSDPIGCTATGVGLSLSAYRDDGVTPIGGDTVTAGEPIKYQATLSYLGAPNCNFEDGTLTINTPDGVSHDVTPIGGIPLVSSGDPFISEYVNYTVDTADVHVHNATTIEVHADAFYEGGTSLLGDGVSPVGANTPLNLLFETQALDVEKDAQTYLTERSEWSITKTVDPDEWWLFAGDSAESTYNVSVTKTGPVQSGFMANGTISITNPSDFIDATITGVSDDVEGIAGAVDCGVSLPYELAPGDTLECSYEAILPDDSTLTNNATVTTSGDIGGGSATATVDFSSAIVNEELASITVEDTNGGSWNFSDSGSVAYDEAFDCSEVIFEDGTAMYTHDNTATIVQTGMNDSASVTVHCYELSVEKDVSTSYDRAYDWDVTKTVDNDNISLSVDESTNVTYTVTANVISTEDDGWFVMGNITISNPNPMEAAMLIDVQDMISPSTDANVDCPDTSVPANSSIVCTYNATLPDGSAQTNTASATQQHYAYDPSGTGTPNGNSTYEGSAAVSFGAPSNVFDAVVNVTDSYAGFLGTAGVNESPKDFMYDRTIGPYDDVSCGLQQVDNTATVTELDSLAQASDDATVYVFVECPEGCTLTQGYWKTHSEYGPAPYDETWSELQPDEADTEFFLSSMSYYEVFWTAPKGNAYYQLAHQYMAAELNMLADAGAPGDVQDAFDDATALFESYSPDDIDALKGNDATRKEFVELAGILGDYNEGQIGPGHCEEDEEVLEA